MLFKAKPWITKDIKAVLNEKKTAFRNGNKKELRAFYGDLKKVIKEAKERMRRKSKLQANNMWGVWSGMNLITGSRPKGGRGVEAWTEPTS